MTKPRFDGTISLGHVLTLVGLIGAVMVAYSDVTKEQALQALRYEQLDRDQDDLGRRVSRLEEINGRLTRIEAILTEKQK